MEEEAIEPKYNFKNAYQLYIDSRTGETKITRLNKKFYVDFELLLGDTNSPQYKYHYGDWVAEVEEGIYKHNYIYYFSFSKAKLKNFLRSNIIKFKYKLATINRMDLENSLRAINSMISKSEKVKLEFEQGTIETRNNLKTLYISKTLI